MAEVKIRKKDIKAARRPDAVLVGAHSVFDWMYEKRVAVSVVFGAALVVIGLYTWHETANAAKAEALGAKLSEAVEETTRPVIEKPAPTEEGEEKVPSFASRAEKDKAVADSLAALVTQSGDTPAGRSAGLDLARIRYSEGKYDEAITLAQKYLDHPDGSGLELFAYETLGDARAAKKDYSGADEAYEKMSTAGAPALALFHHAEVQLAQGKKEEARKLFEKVSIDYEKDEIATEARVQLDLLGMPPDGAGALAAATEPDETDATAPAPSTHSTQAFSVHPLPRHK